MIYLNALLNVGVGTIFWTSLSFFIVAFLLKKFAWGPILSSIEERDNFIAKSLEKAEEAKLEMQSLKAENEKILSEARAERETILKEARTMKEQIVQEAKKTASAEKAKMVKQAKDEIIREKASALSEVKNQVAELSLEIAEKVIKQELKGEEKHQSLVNQEIKSAKLN